MTASNLLKPEFYPLLILVGYLIINIPQAIFATFFAEEKNKPKEVWFITTLFFGFPALFTVALLDKIHHRGRED